jgi:riboflavin biosynthesis pyrimidine reductase
VIRIWPDPGPAELTDTDLLEAYRVEDRARPWVRVNMVSSLDGVAAVDGRSKGLSSAEDRRLLGLLRVLSDVVLVGAGTVRGERHAPVRVTDGQRELRRSLGLPPDPVLAIVSGSLDLDPVLPQLADAPVRPLVITHARAAPERRAVVEQVADLVDAGEDSIDVGLAVRRLTERGLTQIQSEGGPQLLGALTAADLIDEFLLALSPLLTGPGPVQTTAGEPSPEPRRFETVHLLGGDGLIFARYRREGR